MSKPSGELQSSGAIFKGILQLTGSRYRIWRTGVKRSAAAQSEDRGPQSWSSPSGLKRSPCRRGNGAACASVCAFASQVRGARQEMKGAGVESRLRFPADNEIISHLPLGDEQSKVRAGVCASASRRKQRVGER